jgi:hypothetical protein
LNIRHHFKKLYIKKFCFKKSIYYFFSMKYTIKKHGQKPTVSFLCAGAVLLAGTIFYLSACTRTMNTPFNISGETPTLPANGIKPVSWFVSDTDAPTGGSAASHAGNETRSVKEALTQIRKAYKNGVFSGNKKAVIVIDGTITAAGEGTLSNNSLISMTESNAYPPLVFRGSDSGGTLDGENQVRVLYVANNNSITIADGLTLTRGNTHAHNEMYGGGIYLENSKLYMTGGTISNCAAYNGSGVHIHEDKASKHASFTMSGGTIKGGSGSAVFVDQYCSFTLSGNGLITENGLDGSTDNGGGVEINGPGIFTMHNGTISGNKASRQGGGVNVAGFGVFHLFDGIITKNTAPNGSGIFVSEYSAVFNQSGGTITGNYGNPEIGK